jgi:hypothetical protein
MKPTYFIIFLLLFTSFIFPGKIATFPGIFKPNGLFLHKNRIYITEFPLIHIYSSEGFRLIRSFGKKGEGPGEFRRRITRVHFVDNKMLVESRDKISYFTFEGKFLEEKKAIFIKGRHFFPMGDKFVGIADRMENNTLLRTFNIYDADFKKIKEFFYLKREIQPGRGRRPFEAPFGLGVCNNRIFIAFQADFVINVFNHSGEKLFTIKEDYERFKLREDHKKAAYKWFKEASRGDMRTFEFLKRESVYPDYLPGFRGLSVMDNKVCVRTYKYRDNKLEFYFYDCSGKFLGKKDIPYIVPFYPDWGFTELFKIKNDRLYQLIENEENEVWELHVTPLN